MTVELQQVVRFMNAQKRHHAGIQPEFGDEKVLSFVATCAASGRAPSVAVRFLRGMEPSESGAELDARIEGDLPRLPAGGECITISMCEPQNYVGLKFFGFQVKSHSLLNPALASKLYRAAPPDETRVFAPLVFTVHHGPHAANFFEKIPYEEVVDLAKRTSHVLVAVGEQANISPRWIFHHELRDGALHLFHGDALANKTYLNLRRSSRAVRLILDLRTWSGFAVEGDIEEMKPDANRKASDVIEAAFARGGLSPPSRIYHQRVERASRISPAPAHRPDR